jgi:poly(glycerol-phosphate) alpha-glucosyltransferase
VPNVLVVSNIPTPYNDALFAELARQPGVALRVLYAAARESNRSWTLGAEKGYAYEVLPGWTLGRSTHVNRGLSRAIGRFRPDVAVLTGSYTMPTLQLASVLFAMRGVPTVYWGEELSHDPLRTLPRLVRGAMRAMLRRVCGVLAIGSRARRSYAVAGVPAERVADFRYYADTDRFQSTAADPSVRPTVRATLGLASDDVALLYCGQLIRRKRVDTVLRAMRRLRDTAPDTVSRLRLVIAGDGAEREALLAEARALGVDAQTIDLGFVEPARLPPVFAACDALVLPSEQEGWGVVVPEAMAAGLPVLASDRVNAALDLVRDGENGWRFPVGDDEALSAQLAALLESPARRAAMSRAAESAVRDETPAVAARRMVRLLDAARAGRPIACLL